MNTAEVSLLVRTRTNFVTGRLSGRRLRPAPFLRLLGAIGYSILPGPTHPRMSEIQKRRELYNEIQRTKPAEAGKALSSVEIYERSKALLFGNGAGGGCHRPCRYAPTPDHPCSGGLRPGRERGRFSSLCHEHGRFHWRLCLFGQAPVDSGPGNPCGGVFPGGQPIHLPGIQYQGFGNLGQNHAGSAIFPHPAASLLLVYEEPHR